MFSRTKQKLVLLLLVLLMSITTCVFAAEQPTTDNIQNHSISKVVFRNMERGSYRYCALTGIRFYSNNILINSGKEISSERVKAETDQLIIDAPTTYLNGPYYYALFPFDTNKPQIGNYEKLCWWLGGTNYEQHSISVTFKNLSKLNKVEIVPRTDPAKGIEKEFFIDVYDENSKVTTYKIKPITEVNKVQIIDFTKEVPIVDPYNPVSLIAPQNLTATLVEKNVKLEWNSADQAKSYQVKRALKSDGEYVVIADDITDTTYLDSTADYDINYCYTVVAKNETGVSENSNIVNVIIPTPSKPIPTTNGILKIVLKNGQLFEFYMPMSEIQNFVEWYEKKSNGVGSSMYVVNNSNKPEIYKSTKVYLSYENIVFFDVNEY